MRSKYYLFLCGALAVGLGMTASYSADILRAYGVI